MRGRIITLTTDFGLEDIYVGVMKGVILGINPQATIVDLCHNVPPQDIRQAAFLLNTAWRYFPPDSIHVAVVDPGVGGRRRAIALVIGQTVFLGPDNGIFSYVLQGALTDASTTERGINAFHLTNPRYWLPKPSATFHGRDIFAPVAAHLSLGVPVADLGTPLPLNSLVTFPLPVPFYREPVLVGHILHVDRFGNLVTNVPAGHEALQETGIVVEIAGQQIAGLKRTYADGSPGELIALVGSTGYLEVAVVGGNAAQRLGVGPGEEVTIRPCTIHRKML